MTEKGTVTEVTKTFAVVSVDKKAECAGCGLCLFKNGANKTEFFASNRVGAKIGDTVIVERSESGKLFGAMLAFLIPLILIGLAVGINYLFINNEIWIPILSVIFIAVWFFLLALFDKKLKFIGAFRSEITEILSNGDNGAKILNNNELNTKE